eukprot:TRINITY_DN10616_c1_g1_i1.p1 TRINITY_DN10616_c1_g1~~TRINITY_DN10616_c1_g1_i1.p1  ORF type:complete len:531 (+),score=85.27 TRINITY_DN10616_c1_g1_i1:32-1594(+)
MDSQGYETRSLEDTGPGRTASKACQGLGEGVMASEGPSLEIDILQLSGDQLCTVRLPASCTVGELRGALCEKGYPEACTASLLVGSCELKDNDEILQNLESSAGDSIEVVFVKKPFCPTSQDFEFKFKDLETLCPELFQSLQALYNADDPDEDYATLVFENASSMIRAGFAGEDAPRAVFPTVVGHSRAHIPVDRAYVGDEARRYRGALNLNFPIESGVVVKWDDMETIWHHLFFNELRVAPEEHPVLITEAPLSPKANREQVMKIMFETFSVPAMFIAIQSVLALFASGRTTGIVVDCGESVSRIVPVQDGYALMHAIHCQNLGGVQLTEFMMKMFAERGHNLITAAEREVVCQIKEKSCYIPLDFDAEMEKVATESSGIHKDYRLPNGRIITVGSERFRCPEALFQPFYIGDELIGIHDATFQSIMKCDVAVRDDLFKNVVLSGGTTFFTGMVERLTKEILALAPSGQAVHVIVPLERMYAAWHGGSMLASSSSFQSLWVTQEEYNKSGAAVVHRRCP